MLGIGGWLCIAGLVLAEGIAIEPIDRISDDGSPEQADGDVTRIVDTKVEACPAVDKRIGNHHDDEGATTEHQREKERDGEGIGSMSREEAILAATVAIDGIDKDAYLRIACWAPACHK